MDWDALLLLLVGIYTTFTSAKLARHSNSIKYLCYALAALFFTLGQGGILLKAILSANQITIDSSLFVELTTVTAVSFVLCGLAVFIRESKPVFAQFPLIYAAVPLLLIVSYLFVKDSFAIKEWLISIYQGGALLVALMMYGTHSYRNRDLHYVKYLLSAAIILTITYIVYWFVPIIRTDFEWIWQVLLGISLIIISISCRMVYLFKPPEKIQF